MMKEFVLMRASFLLMAVCVAVLAGCDEKESPAAPQQPAAVVQESGEECLQRAIDKLTEDAPDLDAADAAVRKAVELLPDSAEARLVDGQVAYRKKDYKRALADFNAVAGEKSLPNALRAKAFVARAVVEIAENEFDAARLTLFRALRLDRRNAAMWYHLGLLSRNTYHFDEAAVEQFEMAARLSDPKDPRTQKVRDEVRAARAALTAAAAADPVAAKRDASMAAKLIAEADALRKKKMIRAAIKKYEAAFAADPFSYRAAHETAYLLSLNDKTEGGVDKALLAYRAAIDQRPAVQENYYAAAQLAYANKRWATTVSILNRAIAHDPENLKTLDLFIAALQKAGKGKQSEAWKAYRQELR